MPRISTDDFFDSINSDLTRDKLTRELQVHYKHSFLGVTVHFDSFEKPSRTQKFFARLFKKTLYLEKDRYNVTITVREDEYIADLFTVGSLEEFVARVLPLPHELHIIKL